MKRRILGNCFLHQLSVHEDDRGSLVAVESGEQFPGAIERVYYIFGAHEDASRGFHAHRSLTQWAICVSGSCTLLLDDAKRRVELRLDRPDVAVEIGPWVWREMRDFSPGAVLIVLASAHHDEEDYIRNYTDFRSLAPRVNA